MPIPLKDEGLTSEQCVAKRDSWLDKAVTLEEQGKSDSFVNRAVDQAGRWEDAALDGRA